jgi:cytochrome c556
MRTSRALIACAILSVSVTAASAQPASPSDPIAARKAEFHGIGAGFKAVMDELKKDAPDKAVLAASADKIAANLKAVLTMFPEGSGPAPGVKTRARPEIWTNRAEFDRLNLAATDQAGVFAAAVRSGDKAAIQAQAKALGGDCQSCHQKFRLSDN